MKNEPYKVAVVYHKSDGKIFRVFGLTEKVMTKIDEDDIQAFFPGQDVRHLSMAFVEGKQYLDIDKYKVETDVAGDFMDIVERADILTSFSSQAEVSEELLDRAADIVVSVLSVIDDIERLKKYKEAELRGQARSEVLNFFKKRGI